MMKIIRVLVICICIALFLLGVFIKVDDVKASDNREAGVILFVAACFVCPVASIFEVLLQKFRGGVPRFHEGTRIITPPLIWFGTGLGFLSLGAGLIISATWKGGTLFWSGTVPFGFGAGLITGFILASKVLRRKPTKDVS